MEKTNKMKMSKLICVITLYAPEGKEGIQVDIDAAKLGIDPA
ncbi:MAG TPA: hypothetical protein VMW24_12375 [Sedimentisphaerales bacterium]|nr:hypothetical protein [Sedimentisphaerales bacterium]